jgi:hypothetical protein
MENSHWLSRRTRRTPKNRHGFKLKLVLPYSNPFTLKWKHVLWTERTGMTVSLVSIGKSETSCAPPLHAFTTTSNIGIIDLTDLYSIHIYSIQTWDCCAQCTTSKQSCIRKTCAVDNFNMVIVNNCEHVVGDAPRMLYEKEIRNASSSQESLFFFIGVSVKIFKYLPVSSWNESF